MKKGIFVKFVFLLALCFSLHAGTLSWYIDKEKEHYLIKAKGGKLTYKLYDINVVPQIIETKKYGKRFEAIIYYSNSVGTSVMIDEYHGALFDHKNKKFLGTFPYIYKAVNPVDKVDIQPTWRFDGKKLSIVEEELGLKEVFSID